MLYARIFMSSSLREQYPSKDAMSDDQFDALIDECERQRRDLETLQAEFLSIASHQLRTPITAMNWYLEMLLADDMDLSDRARGYVNEVYQTSQRMGALVNDILNASRLEAGKVVFHPQCVPMHDLVSEVAKDVAPLMKERHATLHVDPFDVHKNYEVYADPTMLRQVVLNLFTNAIRYGGSKEESCRVSVAVEHVQHKGRPFLRLSVTDNGIGVPSDEQEQIFDKFYRADNAVQKATDGSGLGLYIVKMIVESWDGIVAVESKEGEGATFSVTMPQDC